jgi:Flp pilus assembly protein CpaB
MTDARLTPRLRHRLAALIAGPGWRRIALARRVAAGALAVLALGLALAPRHTAGVPVLVAAVDLAAGASLRPADLAVRWWPPELVPAGTLRDPAAADGRVLIGAARAGEPLTDVRLAGPAALGAPNGTTAVPVRLADPGVAALLLPGSRVDVVSVGDSAAEPVVLAAAVSVLAVLPEDGSRSGRLVLVAMPPGPAARVAAASLADQVAVTLR